MPITLFPLISQSFAGRPSLRTARSPVDPPSRHFSHRANAPVVRTISIIPHAFRYSFFRYFLYTVPLLRRQPALQKTSSPAARPHPLAIPEHDEPLVHAGALAPRPLYISPSTSLPCAAPSSLIPQFHVPHSTLVPDMPPPPFHCPSLRLPAPHHSNRSHCSFPPSASSIPNIPIQFQSRLFHHFYTYRRSV